VPPAVSTVVPTGSTVPTRPDPFDEALQKEAKALQAALDRAVKDDPALADLRNQVVVTITPEGLLIQLIDRERNRNLLFDVSSAELKPALVRLLHTISTVLARSDQPVYVGGHTDARPYVGTSKSNWELSFERANNARRVLESSGLDGRVRRVVGYANTEPFNPKDLNADENRRLTILALRTSSPRK
jgi:chemotaxis protein MotB